MGSFANAANRISGKPKRRSDRLIPCPFLPELANLPYFLFTHHRFPSRHVILPRQQKRPRNGCVPKALHLVLAVYMLSLTQRGFKWLDSVCPSKRLPTNPFVIEVALFHSIKLCLRRLLVIWPRFFLLLAEHADAFHALHRHCSSTSETASTAVAGFFAKEAVHQLSTSSVTSSCRGLRKALLPASLASSTLRTALYSSPFIPSRVSQVRKANFGFSC